MQQPGKSDICRLFDKLVTELFVGFELRSVLRDLLRSLGAAPFGGFAQCAAQQAATERAPRNEPQPVVSAGGNNLQFDRPAA